MNTFHNAQRLWPRKHLASFHQTFSKLKPTLPFYHLFRQYLLSTKLATSSINALQNNGHWHSCFIVINHRFALLPGSETCRWLIQCKGISGSIADTSYSYSVPFVPRHLVQMGYVQMILIITKTDQYQELRSSSSFDAPKSCG